MAGLIYLSDLATESLDAAEETVFLSRNVKWNRWSWTLLSKRRSSDFYVEQFPIMTWT